MNQDFGGETYDAAQDGNRLRTQLIKVLGATQDNGWHTLAELAQKCGGSEAGVSARLRDLRKPKFGGMTVLRERLAGGLWRYKVVQ